ncbi:MAG: hypothetical protein SF029_10125 [bacterium]|nr:hypothetical protein [bacterium]
MRRISLLMLVVMLMLAACQGGGDEPTAQSATATPDAQPSPQPTAEQTSPSPEVTTDAANVDVTEVVDAFIVDATPFLPPPRVLATIVLTEEATAEAAVDAPVNAAFDYLLFEQTGGPANATLTIEAYGDGRVVVNGEERQVSQERIAAVGAVLDQVNFFNVQAAFLGPPRSREAYSYRLAVSRGDLARSIQAQEDYLPPEIIQLFGSILSLAQ